MKTTTLANPFVVGRYVSDSYFCDREAETDLLIKQVVNGRNVALISPRRMGKTGLIRHLFNQEDVRQRYYTFFVDIYATTSVEEFVYLLGKSIYETLKPARTAWSEKFFQIITSLRVGFKLDAKTGEPCFDIGLGDIQSPQTTLDEIFTYLENADKPCLVAIDEFQQTGTYADGHIEALLRTKIQQCSKTTFIFSGSKRHVMNNMFNSPSKPFYQSAITLTLEAIPLERYTAFACRLFEERGKQAAPEVVTHIYHQFNGCTWFLQMMMNELFTLTAPGERCTLDKVDDAWHNIVLMQEAGYKDLLSHLAPKQKMLLQAIAKEGTATQITSSAFIKKYNLPSASSVQSSIKPLLKSDIVTQEGDTYRVYDYFLGSWLREVY